MNSLSNDSNQTNLLSYSLDDLVPENTKCRLILSLVKRLSQKELYTRYSSQCKPVFHTSIYLRCLKNP